MDPLPWGAVFDISSDEEPTALEESKACHDDNDDYNWLTRILESVDKVKEVKDGRGAADADADADADDDDDEVVVVGEYNPPKSKAKSKPWKQMKEEDDDDCVVLDGDPDKPVPGVNHSAAISKDDGGCRDIGAVDDDDDDVLVVGEKGQVACRDYPHPRHLCVEFPFNSTPHERYCHLCHCYVCDSIAPCVQWGTGMSLIDHCHATDKQEMWKTQREIFRIGKDSSTPLPVAVTQLNQVASLDVLRSAANSSSRVQVARLLSQTCRSTTIRACSSSSRLGIPNRLLGSSQGRNGVMPHSVSRHVLGVRKNMIRHDRSPTISNLVQRTSSNTISRIPGITGDALAVNESVYDGSSDNASCPPVSNYTRNVVSLDILKEVPSSRQDVLPNVIAGSFTSSQPSMGGAILDSAASRSEVYSQSITPPSNNQSVHQLGNQGHTVTGSGLFPLDFSWADLLGTSDQQTSLGGFQLQGTGSSYEPSTVRQFSSQTAGAETNQFQYDIEGYNNCFVNQDVSVVSDSYSSHDLNFIPPETPAVDAGRLMYCRRAKSRN